MLKIKHLSKKSKVILLVCLIVVLAAASYFVMQRGNTSGSSINVGDNQDSVGLINLNPPTEDEQNAGDQRKSELEAEESRRNTPTESGKTTVKPSITYAGVYNNQLEVGAYVNGVFEDNGKCVLNVSSGEASKSIEVDAIKGANSMDCPVMKIDKSALPVGNWSLTVSYVSSSATGASDNRFIEVN